MKNLSPLEARDRKVAISETKQHLKIIRLAKEIKNERKQKEIQKLMVVDINQPLS